MRKVKNNGRIGPRFEPNCSIQIVLANLRIDRSWLRCVCDDECDDKRFDYYLSRGNQKETLCFIGVPERIRTSDLALRRRSLYPAELPGQWSYSARIVAKPPRGSQSAAVLPEKNLVYLAGYRQTGPGLLLRL